MKITNIIDIPKFVSKYIDNVDCQLHSFCSYLLDRKVDSFNIKTETEENEVYELEYIIDENLYDIKYFINFYLEKIKLDNKYNCLYEMETDLSTFTIELETDDGSKLDVIEVYIDSFTSDKLTFKSI